MKISFITNRNVILLIWLDIKAFFKNSFQCMYLYVISTIMTGYLKVMENEFCLLRVLFYKSNKMFYIRFIFKIISIKSSDKVRKFHKQTCAII